MSVLRSRTRTPLPTRSRPSTVHATRVPASSNANSPTLPMLVTVPARRSTSSRSEPAVRRRRLADLEPAFLPLACWPHDHLGVAFVRHELVGEPLAVVREGRE